MEAELILKTEPMGHQKKNFDLYKGRRFFAFFWDQGTGKSKAILDHAAYAYSKGVIDCVIVIAPNGVHTNWVTDEIPKHLAIENNIYRAYYNGKGKKWEADFVDVISAQNYRDKLKVICFPTEGFSTAPKQKKALEYLLENHKCFGVIDESDDIGNPSARRTKYLLKQAPKFLVRRVATGTPVDSKPLAAWSQLQFLSPTILGQDYWSFRARYSIMRDKIILIGNKEVAQKFVVNHRNLDKLGDIIESCSERVLKEDCMDLPAKSYKPIKLSPSAEQKRVYKEMSERALYIPETEDVIVIAKNALDQLGKLSRITGGFAYEGVPIKDNPKLKWVLANVDKYTATSKLIIWARFVDEIELLAKKLGKRCAVIYGEVTDDAREAEKQRFLNDPACDILISNDTMSRGHTLVVAATSIFYSNSYSLRDRRQMEDRVHRKGQELGCLYIDLLIEDTVDEKVLEILKSKKDVSQVVMKDPRTGWVNLK